MSLTERGCRHKFLHLVFVIFGLTLTLTLVKILITVFMKNLLLIRKLIVAVLLLMVAGNVKAQPYPVYTLENFNDAYVNATWPTGWIDSNLSRSYDPNSMVYTFRTPGHQIGGWAIGPDTPATESIHGYANNIEFDGSDGFLYSRGDSAMNDVIPFQYAPYTTIDNWVFLPIDSISDNTKIEFQTTTDPGLINNTYLDSLQVYYNITDNSTDTSKFVKWTGCNQPPAFPNTWTLIQDSMNNILAPNTHVAGRIAFRHHVVGDVNGALSRIIAIDNVNINTYPLQVSLMNLYCKADKDNNVNLYWSTASENNCAYFIVERTVDGKNFKQIGKVNAVGNSTVKQNYSFQDVTAASAGYNKVMYRLRQVDANNRYGYSPLVQASLTSTGVSNMVNPCLVGNTLYIRFMAGDASTADIQILNSNGQKISEIKQQTAEGLNIATQDFSSMPSGIYIVRVSYNNETLINRFVK